ncbi:MAG: imidazole glycerol phosphate synthase subunit HisH [Gammaproteobacteria bacterium]|nr:MAG: imidazole glycerol phosphate synthase subunit HisH [Gammaproteobacteria bacterium]
MNSIAVIDYGMGNLRSVAKALAHVADGRQVRVTQDPKTIIRASRVVFPGVGAMRDCMHELGRLGLDEVVRTCARSKPFLGICLGMQALFAFSEENEGTPGLDLLPGKVRRFPEGLREGGERLKIPHMGWNQVHPAFPHPLWEGIPPASRFYFVHSYYVDTRPEFTAGVTRYGLDFAAACARDNLFAVQFHPEKSQQAGLRLLANFVHWEV